MGSDRKRKRESDEERSRKRRKKREGGEKDKAEDEMDVGGAGSGASAEDDQQEEIRKRRERLEAWRKARQEMKRARGQEVSEGGGAHDDWSEEEDEMDVAGDEATTNGKEQEDEVDPLDAFMVGITEEVTELERKEASERKRSNVAKHREAAKRGMKFIPMESDSESDLEEEDSDDDWRKPQRKRELEKVDHGTVQYDMFRKDFYLEVPEIAAMTHEEVTAYRETELDGIRIRGKDCPRPIKHFHQCGLLDKVLHKMEKCNYTKPTPIQAQALPAVMSGRDVIGIAKTGSGKTLAFVLPMLRHVLDQRPVEQGEGPIALVMAPTRELAMQISSECKKFAKTLSLRCVSVFGGAGVAHQIGDLKRGAEIVVCTPGRMIDILSTNQGRITNLHRVTFLVLDEADRMFDMGFEPQIMRIIENIRPSRQTVMFSATFPRSVEVVARRILKRPLEITVGGKSVVCDDVTQVIEVRPAESKFRRLLELLEEWHPKGSVLVFVDKQDKCDSLFTRLLQSGYPCLTLHGGRDQSDRVSTISDFKKGVETLMIATSVAARGLDVPSLKLVVNYDSPNHYEDYVHRVGRTGRAGRKGFAYTFITEDEDQFAPDLVAALRNSGQEVPYELQKLSDAYKERKKAGKDVKTHGSGFGGKGFRFDTSEEAKRLKQKKMERIAYGVEDAEEGEEDLSNVSVPTGVDGQPLAASLEDDDGTTEDAQAVDTKETPPEVLKEVMSLLPSDLTLEDPTVVQVMKNYTELHHAGQKPPPVVIAKWKQQLNQAALVVRSKKAAEEVEAASGKMVEEEIEINDYPQSARWKVTHKDALRHITEWTGCAITARGVFVPEGKKPPPGERKLFLFIEGRDAMSAHKAKTEIKRMLSDAATTALQEHHSIGKYTV